jgi:hypothetical protein
VDRYILRYRGPGVKPDKDVERIRALPDTSVLDESSRMMLVGAPETELRGLIESMPDWVMSTEQTLKIPDPRPKITRDAAPGQKRK